MATEKWIHDKEHLTHNAHWNGKVVLVQEQCTFLWKRSVLVRLTTMKLILDCELHNIRFEIFVVCFERTC